MFFLLTYADYMSVKSHNYKTRLICDKNEIYSL